MQLATPLLTAGVRALAKWQHPTMATTEEIDRCRQELRQLHTSLLNTREQFTAWKEELEIAQGVVETGEFQNYVTEVKIDLQQGRQLLAQLPNVEEFTEEEIEKKIGKVSQLLNIGEQVTTLTDGTRARMYAADGYFRIQTEYTT